MFNEFSDPPMENEKKTRSNDNNHHSGSSYPILVEWIHTQWTMKWKRGMDVVKKSIPEIQPKIKE